MIGKAQRCTERGAEKSDLELKKSRFIGMKIHVPL
jgi:hypothetical protein